MRAKDFTLERGRTTQLQKYQLSSIPSARLKLQLKKHLLRRRGEWLNFSLHPSTQLFFEDASKRQEKQDRYMGINKLSHYSLLRAWTILSASKHFLDANQHLTYEQIKKLRPLFARPVDGVVPDECWPTFDVGIPIFSPYAATRRQKVKKGRQSERSQLTYLKRKLDVCALAWR